ncbi:DUF1826 domain-containing protein [Pedobacter duraquae]|uniref:DUF1826 domain-containing protein n=1 Tax=Pedobacter duraquae TaxID=425511 RepID=A0A4R6INR5_9SPHI|nr:DUF1826 domain-containing protein [Pedobacter duraquae]TDO23817.1 hypothetical protein CLV32_0102 [Pedobacter duraquae]
MVDNFSESNQIRVANTFHELVNTHFEGALNASCWYRDLDGDFEEIVSKLRLEQDITEVDTENLLALSLSEEGSIARAIILNDFQLLKDFGASPSLNLIRSYQRDEELDFISTDVYSYHVDRSPIATDTFLCTYYGTSSDILANDQAEQKILIPEIRKKLQELNEGSESEFNNFLIENYFDLHYQPKPGAHPVNLGLGHLWRLTVDHPGQETLPCIHRAPKENDGEYRLLLIC